MGRRAMLVARQRVVAATYQRLLGILRTLPTLSIGKNNRCRRVTSTSCNISPVASQFAVALRSPPERTAVATISIDNAVNVKGDEDGDGVSFQMLQMGPDCGASTVAAVERETQIVMWALRDVAARLAQQEIKQYARRQRLRRKQLERAAAEAATAATAATAFLFFASCVGDGSGGVRQDVPSVLTGHYGSAGLNQHQQGTAGSPPGERHKDGSGCSSSHFAQRPVTAYSSSTSATAGRWDEDSNPTAGASSANSKRVVTTSSTGRSTRTSLTTGDKGAETEHANAVSSSMTWSPTATTESSGDPEVRTTGDASGGRPRASDGATTSSGVPNKNWRSRTNRGLALEREVRRLSANEEESSNCFSTTAVRVLLPSEELKKRYLTCWLLLRGSQYYSA